MNKILMSAGVMVTFLSLILAYVFQYNHFFEVLILGLLLMLIPTASKELHSTGKIIFLYLICVVGGLVIEGGGQVLAHMWHYNYHSLVEHIVLYVWGYPAGGFVLILLYEYVRKYIERNSTHNTKAHQNFVRITIIAYIISTAFMLYSLANYASRIYLLFGLYSFVFSSSAMLSAISEWRSKNSYIRDLMTNRRATVGATLIATYLFMLAQEIPNLAARQWVYTWQTGTALDSLYIGIPLATWVLWPFLTFGTVAVLQLTR